MVDRFDIVAVRVEQKRCVIAGVIIEPFARRPIVPASRFESCLVERIHCRAVFHLKREVDAAGELAIGGWTISRGDSQLVSPEEAVSLALDRDVIRDARLTWAASCRVTPSTSSPPESRPPGEPQSIVNAASPVCVQ